MSYAINQTVKPELLAAIRPVAAEKGIRLRE
jgi:hypothetical protein